MVLIPADCGPRMGTARGVAFHSIQPPGERIFCSDYHVVEIALAAGARVTARRGTDEPTEYDARTGTIVLHPAQVDSRLSCAGRRESLLVAFKETGLLRLAEQELDSGSIELRPPPFGTRDPAALRLARLAKAELCRAPGPNEFSIDSLIALLGVHVLRNYATCWPRLPRGTLAAAIARRVDAYLKENFANKVSVAELAAIAGLSAGHFILAFTKTFGLRPHRQLLKLRLDFAEQLLAKNGMTIAEVAYLSGFSSQSHLTSAMRKYRQATPAQLRQYRQGSATGGDRG